MRIDIRPEQAGDYPQIFQVVQSAFAEAKCSDHDEQHLVDRLRRCDAYIPELALVAEVDKTPVGHIMFTRVQVGQGIALALAPLAVAPAMQGRGIGAALIVKGHHVAKDLGYSFSVLLGHAGYYPRFGYVPASSFGIQCPFDVPDENFMACKLQGAQERLEGIVEYAQAFFEQGS